MGENRGGAPSQTYADGAQMDIAEFTRRFTARLVQIVGEYDADGDSVTEYAEGAAPTYWEEREELDFATPEEAAEIDYSYWEAE